MSKTSGWSWTLTLRIDGKRQVVPGQTIGPAEATKDTLLPQIIRDVESQLRGRSFTVEDFSATRTG